MLKTLKSLLDFLFFRNKDSNKMTDEQIKAFVKQEGIFSYTEDGFTAALNGQCKSYRWKDIETVIGYKVDLLTTDELCLEIYIGDTYLRFTESTPGWYQFNSTLTKYLPVINELWESAIMLPAFATNLTLLFDKQGRTTEEVTKAVYK